MSPPPIDSPVRVPGPGAWGVGLAVMAVVAAWPASFQSWTRWWAVPLALVVGMAVAPGIDALGGAVGRLGPWAALLATLAVVYACVPETDQVRVILVALVAASIVDVVSGGRWTPVLAGTAAGLVLWAGLYGATGRQGALVGALVAFLPVLSIVIVARLGRPTRVPAALAWLVMALAAVAAAVVARTGALGRPLGPAVLSATVAVGAWLAVGWFVMRLGERWARNGA